MESKPKAIVLWNDGVRQVIEGSLVLNHLERLEEQGVEILSCRTCLEYFDLLDKVAVGKVSGMANFIELFSRHEVIAL